MLYERVVEVDELVVLPLGAEPSQRNGRDAETSARCVRGGGGQSRAVPSPALLDPPPSGFHSGLCVSVNRHPLLIPPGFHDTQRDEMRDVQELVMLLH